MCLDEKFAKQIPFPASAAAALRKRRENISEIQSIGRESFACRLHKGFPRIKTSTTIGSLYWLWPGTIKRDIFSISVSPLLDRGFHQPLGKRERGWNFCKPLLRA